MIEVQCRTCLVITDLESSFHIAQKCLLGRTLKEIILLFVPEMVISSLVGEVVCLSCYETLQTFAQFIERCIEVENILKRIRIEIENRFGAKCIVANNKANETNCKNSTSVTLKGSIQKENRVQSYPGQGFRYDLLQPSFIPKKCVRSVQDTSKNGPLDVNNVDVMVVSDTTGGHKLCESCSIPLSSNLSDTIIKCKNCLSVEKEKDKGTAVGEGINLHDGSDLTNSITKNESNSTKPCGDEILHFDEEVSYNILKLEAKKCVNIVQIESLNNYLMSSHNRVISTPQPTEVLPKFINNLSTNGIEVFCYGSFANMENKRILLFGKHVIRCPVCNILFNTHRSFTCHFSNTHIICELPEPEKDVFESVIKKKRVRKGNQCPVCEKNIFTKRLLKKHLWLSHKQYAPYKCERCEKCFNFRRSFEKHVMHSMEFNSCNYRRCSFCDKVFGNGDEFSQHMKDHKSCLCEKCGVSFTSAYHLRIHEIKHSDITDKSSKDGYLCFICATSNFSYHMKVHEGEQTKPYICDKCPKSFSTERRLLVHKKNVHEEKKQFQCPRCKERCSSKVALRNHDRLKHSDKLSHICHICGAQFARGDYFRRHMRSHANSLNPRKRRTNAKKYVKASKGPVNCKYCSKLCRNVYELRTHILSHVKSIRYKCRYCDFRFSCLSNRLRHEKRHKDPNFELSCTICWKRLETKEKLAAHYARHNKTKKYQCDKCEDLFPSKFWLGQHVSEKHINNDDVEKQKTTVLNDALEEFLL